MASYGNPKHGVDRNVDRNANVKGDRTEAEQVVGRPGTPDEGELPPGPDAERRTEGEGDEDRGGQRDSRG